MANTETTHTEGPYWIAQPGEDDNDSPNIEIHDGYGRTATVYGEVSDPETQATALVLAAAPDMLNGLREAEAGLEFAGADKLEEKDGFVPTPLLALRIVRAAIAKATGAAA